MSWQEEGQKQQREYMTRVSEKFSSGRTIDRHDKNLMEELCTDDDVFRERAGNDKWALGVLRSRGLVDYDEMDAGEERVIRYQE